MRDLVPGQGWSILGSTRNGNSMQSPRDDQHWQTRFFVACEGRFALFVPAALADKATKILNGTGCSSVAQVIGKVVESRRPLVALKTRGGSSRVVDMLSGEQLPRIC